MSTKQTEPYDIQALQGAAEFFENLATGAEPAPLAFAQAIRGLMAAKFAFDVQPMETAPRGEDALAPSEIEVHEGAWAVVLGTNAKPIGWVDTHATFAGKTYRNRLIADDTEVLEALKALVAAVFCPNEPGAPTLAQAGQLAASVLAKAEA